MGGLRAAYKKSWIRMAAWYRARSRCPPSSRASPGLREVPECRAHDTSIHGPPPSPPPSPLWLDTATARQESGDACVCNCPLPLPRYERGSAHLGVEGCGNRMARFLTNAVPVAASRPCFFRQPSGGSGFDDASRGSKFEYRIEWVENQDERNERSGREGGGRPPNHRGGGQRHGGAPLLRAAGRARRRRRLPCRGLRRREAPRLRPRPALRPSCRRYPAPTIPTSLPLGNVRFTPAPSVALARLSPRRPAQFPTAAMVGSFIASTACNDSSESPGASLGSRSPRVRRPRMSSRIT